LLGPLVSSVLPVIDQKRGGYAAVRLSYDSEPSRRVQGDNGLREKGSGLDVHSWELSCGARGEPFISLKPAFIGENGLRAGWRLLIFAAIFLACQIGIQQMLAHIAPSLFGLEQAMQRGQFSPQALITIESVFLISLAAAMTVMARIEHRSVGEYGLPRRGAFGKEFWQGVVCGLAMVTAMVLLQRAEHVFDFGTPALHGRQLLQMGLLWGTATLLVGFSEELTFRGYVQFTLASGVGFWPAAAVSSLAFGVIHMSDSFYSWQGLLSAALFGLLFCLILQRTGSLWMAVGFHSAVDFAETFLFSPPTRDLNTAGHLLNCSLRGPDWLTGGAVGPEASLNGLIVFAIVFVLLSRSRVRSARANERSAVVQSATESSGT
jgi:uncharacterized protein